MLLLATLTYAMLALSPATTLLPAQMSEVTADPSSSPRVAYVIASLERFNDGRVQKLAEVGLKTIRVDPVHGNNTHPYS